MWVQVNVVIEVNIGDETLDDDGWMEALMMDLQADLSEYQWYTDGSYAMTERQTRIAEEVAARREVRT